MYMCEVLISVKKKRETATVRTQFMSFFFGREWKIDISRVIWIHINCRVYYLDKSGFGAHPLTSA